MHLKLKDIGQIVDADIRFGDLTVFVGPQASGNTIALEFLKLVADLGYVQGEMKRYGMDWSGRWDFFFDAYFGEGMRGLWRGDTSEVWWSGREINLTHWLRRVRIFKDESVFYVPAQRVLALRDGWPQPFSAYSAGDPFVVRELSERLRLFLDRLVRAQLFSRRGDGSAATFARCSTALSSVGLSLRWTSSTSRDGLS